MQIFEINSILYKNVQYFENIVFLFYSKTLIKKIFELFSILYINTHNRITYCAFLFMECFELLNQYVAVQRSKGYDEKDRLE